MYFIYKFSFIKHILFFKKWSRSPTVMAIYADCHHDKNDRCALICHHVCYHQCSKASEYCVFTGVCCSICPQECLPSGGGGSASRRVVCPLRGSASGNLPSERSTLWGGVCIWGHTPPLGDREPGNMVNAWVVRILLGYILVSKK